MKESVKISSAILKKVRREVKRTKQTIGGFFEVSAAAMLTGPTNSGTVQEWKEKAEKWDTLDEEIGRVYMGTEDADLKTVGRFVVDKFGY